MSATVWYVVGGLISAAAIVGGDVSPRANGIVLLAVGIVQLWRWS